MSTAPAPAQTTVLAPPKEIYIYSHSTLFYWWPVWAAALIMAAVTYIDGRLMAIVPRDTVAVERNIDGETRDVLILPAGKHLPRNPNNSMEITKLHMHVARSKDVGVLFVIISLIVIFITNVPMRGLWSVIVVGTIIFLSIIFAILGWWEHIFTYLSFLDIRINAAGYLLMGLTLLVLWCIVFFWFDRQIYMVFRPGQFTVRLEIGGGETDYDTTGMIVQKQRNDLFRHIILGFGSGDLIVRTAGAQSHTFDLPNVLSLGRRVKEIEALQRSRQVLAGQ